MATVWVDNWTQPISVKAADALESKDALESNDSYAIFSGLDNIPTGGEGPVKIHICQCQSSGLVYAIASVTENEPDVASSPLMISFDGNEAQPALSIAKGSCSLSSGSIENGITIELFPIIPAWAKLVKKLGFSGKNITKISGSALADTIYVIGSDKDTALPNAVLNFDQNEDKVIFVEGASEPGQDDQGGGNEDANATLISDWSNLQDQLARGNPLNDTYKTFALKPLSETEQTKVGDKPIYIGVYKNNNDVYAFASTYSITGETSLIAKGEGKASGDKITGVTLTLQKGENLPALGISGTNVTSVVGTEGADEVYVVGNAAGTTLDFSSGGTDTVKFVGESVVNTIIGGDGDNNKVSLQSGDSNALKVTATKTSGNVDFVGGTNTDSLTVTTVNGKLNATLGAEADVVKINSLAAGATLNINDVGYGSDIIAVNSILGTATFIANSHTDEHRIDANVGEGGKAILQYTGRGTLTGGSGTRLNVRMENSTGLTVATTDNNYIALKNATVEGAVSVKGSVGSDTFHISEIVDGSNVTLDGVGGSSEVDTYQFDNIAEDASVTIENFKYLKGFNKDDYDRIDTLVIGGSLGDSIDTVKFNSDDKTLMIGNSKITVNGYNGSSGDIYVKLASDQGTQVYRINKNGAFNEKAAAALDSTLIDDWSESNLKAQTGKGQPLTGNTDYKNFAVPTLKEAVDNFTPVYIGVKEIDNKVYTFVSKKEMDDETKKGFIATGEGVISDGKIGQIMLELQSNATTNLGISGNDIDQVFDSDDNDEIYVTGNTDADFLFQYGGNDTIYFTQNAEVGSVTSSVNTVTLKASDGNPALKVNVGTIQSNVDFVGGTDDDSLTVTNVVRGTLNATLGGGKDNVTIDSIDPNATLNITDEVGEGGSAILQAGIKNVVGKLTGGSGTKLTKASMKKDSDTLVVAASGSEAITLDNASVEGAVSVKGSDVADTFNIKSGSAITLEGGKGGDEYTFDNGVTAATITDFGLSADSAGKNAASPDELGLDVIDLTSVNVDASKITFKGDAINIGESGNIKLKVTPSENASMVYAKLKLSGDTEAKVYQIDATKASDPTVTPDPSNLIKDWSKGLDTAKGAALGNGDGYKQFAVPKLTEADKKVASDIHIGVKTVDSDGVYAFASTQAITDASGFIATGTGKIEDGEITVATLNLQADAKTVLGIDNYTSSVQTVVGSTGKDEIYVVGDSAGSFDFSSGAAADTIKFVRESGVTVTEIKGNQVFLQSAKDNDALSLYVNNTSGNINFVGGASTDSLTVGTLAGKLVANLGAENDSVVIKGGNGTVSLTGEGGVDTYKFADDVKATITDFGLAKDSLGKTEAIAGSGVDVIDIGDVALTDVKFSSGDKTIKVGSNITLKVAPTDGTTMVYAMLKSGTEPAKVYQIDATKASTPTGGQSDPVVESHLIENWNNLDTAKGAPLGAGTGYKQFAVPTLTDADKKTVRNNTNVYIGVKEVNGKYCAFASLKEIADASGFIAAGSGSISNGEITDVKLTLQKGENFPALGISGTTVTSVEGSDGPDEVYVTGDASGTKFNFQQGGTATDTILFTKAATVKKIIANGGGKVSLKAAGDVALDVNVTEAVGNIEFMGDARADKLTVNKFDALVADLGAGNDSVDIKTGNGKVTLTGGKGNDTYTLGSDVAATITDFGFVNASKAALDTVSGIDILNVASIDGAKLENGSVQIGDVLLLNATGTTVYANIGVGSEAVKVYAIDSSGAKVLVDPTPTPDPTPDPDPDPTPDPNPTPDPDPEESGGGSSSGGSSSGGSGSGGSSSGGSSSGGSSSGGSSSGGSSSGGSSSGGSSSGGSSSGGSGSGGSGSGTGTDTTSGGSGTDTTSGGTEPVTYETVSGASGTFDAGSVDGAAYVDLTAQTGDVVIKGAQSYDGTNDSEATVINTSGSVDDMTQEIKDGNLVLTDASGKSVTIENVEPGSAIKVGSTDNPEVLVIGGTGSTAVSEGLAEADYYMGASGENTAFDFSKTDKTVIDLSGASSLDGATYKYVKGVTGSEAGESLLISGADAVTLQAAGNDDTLFGAGAGNDTLVSASGKSTNFMLQTGNGEDVVQGFTFGTDATSDKILVNTGITYDETIIKVVNGQVVIGENGADLILSASGQDTVAMSYNYGGNNPGVVMIDVSENGSEMAFNNNYNIIVGQGEKSTLVAASGDTVQALSDTMPSGIGWNSVYLVSDVGVLDASASEMTAVNGAKNSSDLVKAATGSNLDLIWVCGGIGANFSDQGNDTLVASGQGHDEIFVGAKMGDDMVQNVASNDKITFIDTKVSDFGGDINNILKVDSETNTFTATFASGDKTTTIKSVTAQSASSVANLTFHFDDVDYVWDGNKFNQVTNS